MIHYQLKIKEVIRETLDAITVIFENPESGTIKYKPGQFLTLVIEKEGEKLRRAYSLCSSPLVETHPAITIKKVANGKISGFLNETLKAGDVLEVLEPAGQFTTEYDPSKSRHLVMFAGGSGITPMMSLLQTALHYEFHTEVSLIYCNKNMDSVIFKNKLESILQKYPNRFRLIHILEEAPDDNWNLPTGFLNTRLIDELLKQLPQKDPDVTEYFMCGPGPMMDVIEKAFEEINIPKEKLKKEVFGLSPEEAAQKKAEVKEESTALKAREVKVIYDGEEYVFTVEPDKTILETALSMDIDLPYSCQSGLCTACMGKCISGKVKLDEDDALTDKELQQGYVLTCVGHPMTDDVVIVID